MEMYTIFRVLVLCFGDEGMDEGLDWGISAYFYNFTDIIRYSITKLTF